MSKKISVYVTQFSLKWVKEVTVSFSTTPLTHVRNGRLEDDPSINYNRKVFPINLESSNRKKETNKQKSNNAEYLCLLVSLEDD